MALTVHIRQATASAGSGDAWWKSLSKDQQREYIKAHPNSKYARNAAKHAEEKHTEKKHTKEDSKKPSKVASVLSTSVKALFGSKLKTVPKEHREFFEHEGDKPGSEERKGIAKHIRHNKHEVIKHIKGQFTEWKDGCGAIGKLATGKKISDHEKKALKGLLIDAAVIAGAVAVTGGFAHGAALAMKHIGFDVLKDVVLKATIRGTSKAMGASLGHTGLMAGMSAFASDRKQQSKADLQNEKVLEMLVEQMAKFMEKGKVPKDTWEKVIDELAAKGKKLKK